MINAWSLLHEEYYGTMAKTYPIKENDMSPCKTDIKITSLESDEYDPIVTVGSGIQHQHPLLILWILLSGKI